MAPVRQNNAVMFADLLLRINWWRVLAGVLGGIGIIVTPLLVLEYRRLTQQPPCGDTCFQVIEDYEHPAVISDPL